jgi:2-polyprenyl-3-methyl-5-hydroxy-6-metoxy-1,4-benzoquinol methylase
MPTLLGKRYSEITATHDYIAGDRAKAREAIVRNILPSVKMVEVPCLCGNSTAENIVLSNVDRWGLPARSALCTHCGLIRVDPRWDEETYSRIYKEYFWPLQVGFFDITRERFNLSVRRAGSFAKFLKSHVDLNKKSLLEIGCSYGAGLFSLKGTGASLTGYDYDDRCLSFGRTFTRLDLRGGGIKEAVNEGKRYDVVVLRHVLEHVLNPRDECPQLHSLLKDKGVLLVEVPGVFNLSDMGNDPLMYFNAFHTFSYSLKTLNNLMNAFSFKYFYGDERIFSLWERTEKDLSVNWNAPDLSEKVLRYFLDLEQVRSQSYRHFFKIIRNGSRLLKNIGKTIQKNCE